jgi:hypothetical protein
MSKLMKHAALFAAMVVTVVLFSACSFAGHVEGTEPAVKVPDEQGLQVAFDTNQYCVDLTISGQTYKVSPADALEVIETWPNLVEAASLEVLVGPFDHNGCQSIESILDSQGGERWANVK